jgi:uncharacterized protein YecE (DUF72 family)
MITVGCCGFPVPATRYFKEFSYTEVGDAHGATPASGSVRRWKREAPPTFRFAIIATKEIGAEGFREGKVIENALTTMTHVARDLSAATGLFIAPAEFTSSRANKAAVKEFLTHVRPRFERVVWEPPPSWEASDAEAIARDAGVIAARDPLSHGLSPAKVGYYRLPGPAGHKSRYEDPAIDKLAELARAAKHDDAFYVFTNVDMFADAKRFKKLMKLP